MIGGYRQSGRQTLAAITSFLETIPADPSADGFYRAQHSGQESMVPGHFGTSLRLFFH